MIEIGKKTGLPGFDVQIVSPKDGATVQRGNITVVVKASFLRLPPPLILTSVYIRWKKAEDKSYALFKNRAATTKLNPFSKIYRKTIAIEEPGKWNIIAILEDIFMTGPYAAHEIEITVV